MKMKKLAATLAAALLAGVMAVAPVSAAWQQTEGRWWYQQADGSYPKDSWSRIGGAWYLFDKDGYMLTGWQQLGGSWYYLDANGVMTTGWLLLDGSYYYLDSSGVMVTGTQTIDGTDFVFNKNGILTGYASTAESKPAEESKPVEGNKPIKEKPTAGASTGRYVGSKNSDKYHRSTCPTAQRISSKNEIWFDDAADARRSGYVPCKVCKP